MKISSSILHGLSDSVMSTQDITFIRVTKDTRGKLAAIGAKSDTYNSIILKLLESE